MKYSPTERANYLGVVDSGLEAPGAETMVAAQQAWFLIQLIT